MTDALLDQLLAEASLALGRADFEGDVACCAGVARAGSAQTFGSIDDGLDKIDDSDEIADVLGDPVARFKVVRIINYCGGAGTNIMMFFCLCGTSWGLTQTECNRFHTPMGGADAEQTDLGACRDFDVDEVLDQADNCAGAPNNGQADGNGDGEGDVCQDGCGNGELEAGEECDTSELAGETCSSQGYLGGALRCRVGCVFDESDCIGGILDVDGNGETDPLSDGVLVVRWLFDFRGDELIDRAIDEEECTRCDAPAVQSHLAGIS